MKSTKNAQKPVIKCNNFKIESLTFKYDKENKTLQQNQLIAFPKYNYTDKIQDVLYITTDPIKIVQYGIPKSSKDNAPGESHYYDKDEQRQFIKLALDPKQESCVNLRKLGESIDKYVKENIKNILPEDYFIDPITKEEEKTGYTPIIRKPSLAAKKRLRENKRTDIILFDYIKLKLGTDFKTKFLDAIVVKQEKTIVDGKQVIKNVKLENINNVSDLCNYIKWGYTLRFVLAMNKLWAQKNSAGTDENASKSYGVTLKVIRIDITDEPEREKIKEQFNNFEYDDDGTIVATNPKETESDEEKKITEESEDTETESEEEEEEEKPKQPIKKPITKKIIKKEEDDD